jgi:hypothetical protein
MIPQLSMTSDETTTYLAARSCLEHYPQIVGYHSQHEQDQTSQDQRSVRLCDDFRDTALEKQRCRDKTQNYSMLLVISDAI